MKFNNGDKVKVVISDNIDSISAFYEASELGWGDDEMAEVVTNQKVGVVTGNWSDHKGYVVKFDNDEYWTFFPEHLRLVDEYHDFEMIETEQQKFEESMEGAKDAATLLFILEKIPADDPRFVEGAQLVTKIAGKYAHMKPSFDDLFENIKKKYADL